MKDFKRFIVPIVTLSVCAVLIIAAFFFWQKKDSPNGMSDQIVQEKHAMERLLSSASDIQRLWIEGEESRSWNLIKKDCLNDLQITTSFDESLLRCNPRLIQCFSRFSKNLPYSFNTLAEKNLVYRYMSRSNSYHVGLSREGYLFSIVDKETKKELSFLLNDQCHEFYLQQRIYAYGEEPLPKSDADDYRFDNFGQHLFIDRHLVTNAEINDWILFGNTKETSGLKVRAGNDLFLPAGDLTLIQMQNYCSFRGKQLLLAHVFDAATFLPQDLNETEPKKNTRSPYYWAKKKNEFIPQCQYIFAKECLKKGPFKMNSTGPTWTGLMDPLGGIFEAFRNPIDSESNLKASSFYFDFKSPWHKLGFRALWDGEGHDLRHFDFKGLNPDVGVDKFQVGFRCMREAK